MLTEILQNAKGKIIRYALHSLPNAYFVVCEGSSPVSIGKRSFGILEASLKKIPKNEKTPTVSEFFVRHLYCYLFM